MLKKVLAKIKYVLVDLDGTAFIGNTPLGDVCGTLSKLRAAGKIVVFIANNSSLSVQAYTEKLKEMGLYDEKDYVYTSGLCTAEYVRKTYPEKTCMVIGTQYLKDEFVNNGIALTDEAPDIVVLGTPTNISYPQIASLVYAVKKGAIYIATHGDSTLVGYNVPLPDCGAFVKMLENSTKIVPNVVLGKPNEYMGKRIMVKFRCNADEVMVIGDSLKTDVQFGINCGFYTLLVLTGDTTEKELKQSDVEPDFVLSALDDITAYLAE